MEQDIDKTCIEIMEGVEELARMMANLISATYYITQAGRGRRIEGINVDKINKAFNGIGECKDILMNEIVHLGFGKNPRLDSVTFMYFLKRVYENIPKEIRTELMAFEII